MSSNSVDAEDRELQRSNIVGDRLNFVLVTFLYVLQGVVIGVTVAIPLILQKRNVTYTDQVRPNKFPCAHSKLFTL